MALPASQREHGPTVSLTSVFRSPEMGKNKSQLPEAPGLRYFVVVIPGLESNLAESSLSRCCHIHSKLHLGLLCSAGSKHKGQNVRLLSVIYKAQQINIQGEKRMRQTFVRRLGVRQRLECLCSSSPLSSSAITLSNRCVRQSSVGLLHERVG